MYVSIWRVEGSGVWFSDGNTELLTVKVLPRMEMSVYFELSNPT